jgi:hypothetical protein
MGQAPTESGLLVEAHRRGAHASIAGEEHSGCEPKGAVLGQDGRE